LAQNLKAGAAKAVINTAINGGSFEDNLKESLKSAVLDTVAAQGANAIGDANLDSFTNKVAHAIAGCAVGAARTDGSCAAGALGAAIGEMAAETYGRQADTVQLAAMVSGIAAAIAGGDAAQINLASQAGGNAAANNYLNHDEAALRERLNDKQRNGQALTAAEQTTLDNLEITDIARDLALRDACKTPGDACDAARRGLNAALNTYTGAGAMIDPRLSPEGNAAIAAERDQDLAVANDPNLAAQSLLDSFKEFAVPQLAGYAVGGALGAYINEARAIYAGIRAGGSDIAQVSVDAAMLNELAANGIKFSPENVLATVRTGSGQVVFLEAGNSRSGLQHIVEEHADDFANIGVARADIPGILVQAITEGKIVGYQGAGFGRPIYQTSVNGEPQRLAITISRNGYIVGANPAGK
jgi:filamentous hemagglutinin